VEENEVQATLSLTVKVSKQQDLQQIEALMVEKKVKSRKRHIVTDTQGNLLHVSVHAANIHDTKKGGSIFAEALKKYPTLKSACFDEGYRGTTVRYVEDVLHKKAYISSKITDQ